MTTTPQRRPHDHAVQFYNHDAEVVAEVARFVAAGLDAHERAVIVGTAPHRAAIEDVLPLYGYDVDLLRVTGRLVTLDAAEMLATFMVGGRPDADAFNRRIGSIIDAAGADGSAVRVFGEMVALLWDDGNVAGAVQLEHLWNELAADRQFTLLCAYAVQALGGASLADATDVCVAHSLVLAPGSYRDRPSADLPSSASSVQTSELFLPVAAAIPPARRFVAQALRSWGADALLTDAELMVSELATNAVMHAASAFRVLVSRSGPTIRIAVEDVGPTRPELRRASSEEFHGRGVAIVERIATAWGCDVVGDGKIVWGELSLEARPPVSGTG